MKFSDVFKNVRERFAWWLMRTAYVIVERIDRKAVPKYASLSFTFESGEGFKLRNGQRGCKLFYLNDWDYERAHDEAEKKV